MTPRADTEPASTGASDCALTRRGSSVSCSSPDTRLPARREGKASRVVAHVLDLSDDELSHALADIEVRFGQRHRDLTEMFERHAERLVESAAARRRAF